MEFSKELALEDIEVVEVWKDLDPIIAENIKLELSKADNFKIDKIQRQYSSQVMSDEKIIQEALINLSGDVIRYELEVELKNNKVWSSYELLFDDQGILIQQKKIVKRVSDFILY